MGEPQPREVEFLDYVVRSIVAFPEDVRVNRVVDEMGVLLTLDINAADMGRVIGKMGNTAKAIRTLLRVVGMATKCRVNLKITDPHPEMSGRLKAADPEETMSEVRREFGN